MYLGAKHNATADDSAVLFIKNLIYSLYLRTAYADNPGITDDVAAGEVFTACRIIRINQRRKRSPLPRQ